MKFNEYRRRVLNLISSSALSWLHGINSFGLVNNDIFKCLRNIGSLHRDLITLTYWNITSIMVIKAIELSFQNSRKSVKFLTDDKEKIKEFISTSKAKINRRINKDIMKLIKLNFNPNVIEKLVVCEGDLLADIRTFQSQYNDLSAETRNVLKIYLESKLKEATSDVKQIYTVT